MDELKFDIKQNITVLSEGTKGWKREVNIVSWNDHKPKLDIRDWDSEHKKMGKGISLNGIEAAELKKVLADIDLNSI